MLDEDVRAVLDVMSSTPMRIEQAAQGGLRTTETGRAVDLQGGLPMETEKKAAHVVVGIHITNRVKRAPAVQVVLTEFGCNIKTRIGLHEVADSYCSPSGLVLVEFVGDQAQVDAFEKKLESIEGIDVKTMVFEH